VNTIAHRLVRAGRTVLRNTVVADFAYAVRVLRSSRAYTAAAVLTLTIGIAGTTTIFSIVDGVLLKPLPFSSPGRVVALYQSNRAKGSDRDGVAPANFADWRARSGSFAALAAAEPFAVNYTTQDGVEQIFNWNVTRDFFAVLDARPAIGRLFVPSDFTPGLARVVILTYASWQSRFGADPSIIGRRLRIGSGSLTVVGVLAQNFDYLASSKMELYLPIVLDSAALRIRNTAWYEVVGRLKPGVSLMAARADLGRVSTQLAREYPATNTNVAAAVEPLASAVAGDARRPLELLLGAVSLVLLIACVNVASLVLARGVQRRREIAVRVALGASRWRVVRQLMAENLLLGLGGGIGGLIVASWTIRVIATLDPGSIPRLNDVRVDLRALACTIAIALIATLVFGLFPVLRTTALDPAAELRAGVRASGDGTRGRVRRALAVAEVALAFVLLVGSALLLRSFVSVLHGDRGYRSDHVLAATVFVYQWARTPRSRAEYIEALLRQTATLPRVIAAGATSSLPLDIAIGADQAAFTIDGRPVVTGEEPSAHMTAVTVNAFSALGIPLRRGREFTAADDSGNAGVVVINAAMARRFWPNEDPIGKQLRFAFYSAPEERTVVGIVADTRQRALDAPADPIVYVPLAQAPTGAMTLVYRTTSEPRLLLRDLKRAVGAFNPALPLADVETLDELAAASVQPREFVTTLAGAFAVSALVLALVGIYGVVNQGVIERRGELGVRLALGAQPIHVVRLVLRQAIVFAALGVAVGIGGAAVITVLMRSMLVGVQPFDAPTFLGVGVVMVVTAAAAAAVPAVRAGRIDALESIRAG
jgi:putative ABC transport system permease protein